MPTFKNQENFLGKIIHPQFWDESLDYRNKKIVVIGSGATAVTIVPAIAEVAEHVVMLQRSPTYVVSGPSEDSINKFLRKILPTKFTYFLIRWKTLHHLINLGTKGYAWFLIAIYLNQLITKRHQ
jgi:cation diffusion facilitator CzcD-associated flavoprotein CzcO